MKAHWESDPVIMETEIEEEGSEGNDTYKRNRVNYRKADVGNLVKYFRELEWDESMRTKEGQEK